MLILLISAALAATAAEDARHSQWSDKEEKQCFDTAITQTAMTGCADAAYRRADARMSAQWLKTAAAFKRMDQESKRTPWPTKAFESLLQGQRAWLTYRDATCRAQGMVNAGGTIAPMNELLCRAGITDLRTKELFELSRNPNNPDESI
jgi:uncharacterized protein YecT (DUF1311 family)